MSLPRRERPPRALVLLCACVAGGCARSTTIGGPPEAPPCTWTTPRRIDLAPVRSSETTWAAETLGDGTATLVVPVENDEVEYGYRTYRVDTEMNVIARTATPDFFTRIVRREGDLLATVALETTTGDCLYRETTLDGVELRRHVLITANVPACAADRFGIDATHVLESVDDDATPYKFDRRLVLVRRSDFAAIELDPASDPSFEDAADQRITPTRGGGFFLGTRFLVEDETLNTRDVTGDDDLTFTFGTVATPHGDGYVFGFIARDLVDPLYVVRRRGASGTFSEIAYDGYTRGFDQDVVWSTDARAGLVTFLDDRVEIWMNDRDTDEDTLFTIDSWMFGDPNVRSGAVASSPGQAYLFWLREDAIYGASLTCGEGD